MEQRNSLWVVCVTTILVVSIIFGVARGGDVGTITNEDTKIETDVFYPHVNYTYFNQTYGAGGPVNNPVMNTQIDVDGVSEYTFDVMVYHAQGIMSNISYVDIVAWYDEGDDTTYYDYDVHNASHPGSNLNMHLRYNVTYNIFYMLYGNESGECWLLPTSHSNLLDPNHLQLKFVIRPYYQIRWAPGEGSWTPGPGFNDAKSWNFNVTAYDPTGNPSLEDRRDEYGVYKFIRFAVSGNPSGSGRPGETIKLTSSTVNYSANCPYRLSVNITNLTSGPNKIPASAVSVCGGDLDATNFPGASKAFYIYGDVGTSVVIQNVVTDATYGNWQRKVVRDSQDNLYVAYIREISAKRHIMVAKSTDNGETWTEKDVTFTAVEPSEPSLAVDSKDILHLVWVDKSGANYQIYYSNSTSGGASWSTPLRISDSSLRDNYNPSIVVDFYDDIEVCWVEDNGAGQQAVVMNYTSLGLWQTKKFVSQWSNGIKKPSIYIDSTNNGAIYVWQNVTSSGRSQIFYADYTYTLPTYGTQLTYFTNADARNASAVVDGFDVLHVVFDVYNYTSGNHSIWYKKLGAPPVQISSEVRNPTSPSIAIDENDNLYVAWQCSAGIRYKIYNGEWRPETSIHINSNDGNVSLRWSFNNNPYTGWSAAIDAVWTSINGSWKNVTYRAIKLTQPAVFPPAGAVGTTPYTDATAYNGQRKIVRTSTGLLFAVYVGDYVYNSNPYKHIFVVCSDDGGETWYDFNGGTPISFDGGWEDLDATYPAMAIDGNDWLHVVWTQDQNICYKCYDLGGWSSREIVSTGLPAYEACIDVDAKGVVHAAWSEEDSFNIKQIRYNFRTNTGWYPTPTQLSTCPPDTDSEYPSIGINGMNDVYVVWQKMDSFSQEQIYYNYQVGGSWVGQKQLTTGSSNNYYPCMAIDYLDNVHIVWANVSGGQSISYWNLSQNEPITISNASVGTAYYPSIGIDGWNALYVMWYYDDGYNYNITLRRFVDDWWWPEEVLEYGSVAGDKHYYPNIRWSYYYNYAGDLIDYIWTFEDGGGGLDVWYCYLDVAREYVAEKYMMPLGEGFYSNGTTPNELLTIQWWIDIPYGMPEGHYTAPITYRLIPKGG